MHGSSGRDYVTKGFRGRIESYSANDNWLLHFLVHGMETWSLGYQGGGWLADLRGAHRVCEDAQFSLGSGGYRTVFFKF